MSPHDAAERLAHLAKHLAEVLPPTDRWLPAALLRRVRDPDSDLDRLLGLRGNGGRGRFLGCPMPERNRRLRAFAASLDGVVADKAARLLRLLKEGDPELVDIDRLSRIPRSKRQLQRILSDI